MDIAYTLEQYIVHVVHAGSTGNKATFVSKLVNVNWSKGFLSILQIRNDVLKNFVNGHSCRSKIWVFGYVRDSHSCISSNRSRGEELKKLKMKKCSKTSCLCHNHVFLPIVLKLLCTSLNLLKEVVAVCNCKVCLFPDVLKDSFNGTV